MTNKQQQSVVHLTGCVTTRWSTPAEPRVALGLTFVPTRPGLSAGLPPQSAPTDLKMEICQFCGRRGKYEIATNWLHGIGSHTLNYSIYFGVQDGDKQFWDCDGLCTYVLPLQIGRASNHNVLWSMRVGRLEPTVMHSISYCSDAYEYNYCQVTWNHVISCIILPYNISNHNITLCSAQHLDTKWDKRYCLCIYDDFFDVIMAWQIKSMFNSKRNGTMKWNNGKAD